MTDIEREKFNEVYKKHKDYSKDIIEVANKITKSYTSELENCISKILVACNNESQLGMNFDELEKMALKIPSLCLYIQIKLNDFTLRGNVEEIMINAQVMEYLESIKDQKGDSREKMKRAEASQFEDRIIEMLDKQICSNLRDIITRADKVYEGVKKIIDARMRENEYNRKSQQFGA